MVQMSALLIVILKFFQPSQCLDITINTRRLVVDNISSHVMSVSQGLSAGLSVAIRGGGKGSGLCRRETCGLEGRWRDRHFLRH